jgi:hypothetical protein
MRWFLIASLPITLFAQNTFVGAMSGVATLSADARTVGSPPSAVSAYKPENGASWLVYSGRHITDYVSAQVSYSRSDHDVSLTGLSLTSNSSLEQPYRAKLHTLGFEAMGYFRARDSRVRPYLSAGPVATWTRASSPGLSRIASTGIGLRVAVGMDLRVHEHVDLRYTFSETIQGNAFSRALNPPGQRKLANFQNLWGVVFRF